MSELLKAVVVLARCTATRRPFGMRFEEKGRATWIVDWAFPMPETTAKREGYDRNTIAGEFRTDPKYPGCPGCSARDWFRCCCGKIGCWSGTDRHVTCPWCFQRVALTEPVTSVSSSTDG